MIRAPLGDQAYWSFLVDFFANDVADMLLRIQQPSGNPSYRPQYLFELTKENWHLLLTRYSRGDAISELAQYFEPILVSWEESERLGANVWTDTQKYTRSAWTVNLDHYIVCFWLIGLALSLEIPDDQWHRLIRLVGNEGEDALLDRIIATRSPDRKIGSQLCFTKPYARLLAAVTAPAAEQAAKLKEFLDHWYPDLAAVGKSGRAKQASSYVYPYWYKLGDQKLDDSGYFGRWCIEAVAAVKAFGLDDSSCLGHEHYPGDLLRSGLPTTHPQLDRQVVNPPNSSNPSSQSRLKKSSWWKKLTGKT